MLHQLAWLVVAAGVVVEDRGYTSTSTVYAALDLGPRRYVVSVALKATPAEIETTATNFCREHRADITTLAPGIDGAWAAGACAGLVRGAIHDALAPRFELSNRSMAIVDFGGDDDGRRRVEVATVATAPEGLGRLVASLAAHDHALAPRLWVLGLGLGFVGTVQKIVWTRSWLTRLPSSSLVLFVDAYDTVFQRPLGPNDVPPPGSIVFGADRVCSPDVCAGPLARTPKGMRFLNAGSYLGEAAAVSLLLEGALAGEPPTTASDQYVLSRHVARRASAVRVVLDVDNRLFSPLDGVPRDAFTVDAATGLWYDSATGLAPLVLHFNRDAKARLDEVAGVSADGVVARLRAIAARGTIDDGDSSIETIKYVLSWWRLICRRQRRQGVLDGGRGRDGCGVPGSRLANDRSLLRDERLGDGHVAHLHARPMLEHDDGPVRELVLPRVAPRLEVQAAADAAHDRNDHHLCGN
jgi:hypothetical protein